MFEEKTKNIAVVYGGTSCEKDASTKNAQTVISALQNMGHQVSSIGFDEGLIDKLKKVNPDVVFICVQGKGHGDGTIQAICDFYQWPYTGSNTFAATIINNKKVCKELCSYHGFITPPFFSLNKDEYKNIDKSMLIKKINELEYPVMVKGITQGGSYGITRLMSDADINEVDRIFEYDDELIFEKFISGKFISSSLLKCNGTMKVLTPLDIKTTRNTDLILCDKDSDFYVEEANLSKELEEDLIETSLALSKLYNVEGYTRLDFILDNQGVFHFLEINAVPGLREQSLFPHAASLSGISIEEVINNVLQSALEVTD